MTLGRVFYWSQLVVAGILLVIDIAGWVLIAFDNFEGLLSFHGGINVMFVVPGLILSLLINHFILRAKKTGVVSTSERVILSIEFVLIALLLASWPFQEAFGFAIILWPVLILTAIVACVTTSVQLARSRSTANNAEAAVVPVPRATTPIE
jgi:hypothetical protein